MCYILSSYHKMTSWILLLRKKGVKKNKEVHETKAPSEGPFCQAHNLELLYFCLIAAAAVLGNKKRENAPRLSAVSLFLVKYLLQTFEALKGPFFVWRNILRFFDDELLFSFCALRQVRALISSPVWLKLLKTLHFLKNPFLGRPWSV